jgi:ketosteroid isomerase-like protein
VPLALYFLPQSVGNLLSREIYLRDEDKRDQESSLRDDRISPLVHKWQRCLGLKIDSLSKLSNPPLKAELMKIHPRAHRSSPPNKRLPRFVNVLLSVGMFSMVLMNSLPALAQANDANATEIESILKRQTQAWNDGDLETFMQTYWKSDKLTFSSGGKTTYGWQPTLDNYKRGYPSKKAMGKLHFDGLRVSMIESNSALVLGRWHLRMDNSEKKDGNFSLVVKKIDSKWKIIHDHSSSLDPPKEAPGSE